MAALNHAYMNGELLFLQNLCIALLLGGLVGLEREKDREETGTHEFGGIRTMSLVAVLGYLVYALFGSDQVIFAVFTAGFVALVLTSYIISSFLNKSTGVTTEFAAIFVYMVGLLMAMGESLYASVMTLLVLLLLYFKEALHSFAHKVEKKELYSTLKFIAVVFVILPLLPNQAYGPLEVLNPYVIWLMVVFVSAISFVSYLAIKLIGARKGVGLGGFLGGLISSTAVAMSFSQMSKKGKKLVNPFVFGILIASTAMFFRVLLEVSVLNAQLLEVLMGPMLVMGGCGFLLSLYFWFAQGEKKAGKVSDEQLNLSSPFQLKPALHFGVFFAVLLFVAKFATVYFGDQGIYLTALLSGLADVDAITVSMANLSATGDVSLMVGAFAVVIAALSNTLVKGFIVVLFASEAVGRRIAFSMVLIAVIGIISLFIFNPELYGFIAI